MRSLSIQLPITVQSLCKLSETETENVNVGYLSLYLKRKLTLLLTYFNNKGRAEISRLIFAAAGIQYEDVRLTEDQWLVFKPATPFGQLPILEVDGVTFCQSNSMARFLARRFDLAGNTELDQARADMIIDCLEDINNPIIEFIFYEKDETRKAALKKKIVEEQLPKSLDYLEKILKTNNGGDGFFVGQKLTWSDLGLIVTADWLVVIGAQSQLDNFQKLAALYDRVRKLPKIAEWLAKRPVTPY